MSEISGIDAVITGHEHLLINTSYKDNEGKDVLVVEAGYYFQNAGVLSLTYDKESNTVTDAEETFVYLQATGEGFSTAGLEDKTVADLIASIQSSQAAILEEPIGYSDQEYPYISQALVLTEYGICEKAPRGEQQVVQRPVC